MRALGSYVLYVNAPVASWIAAIAVETLAKLSVQMSSLWLARYATSCRKSAVSTLIPGHKQKRNQCRMPSENVCRPLLELDLVPISSAIYVSLYRYSQRRVRMPISAHTYMHALLIKVCSYH